ncbi:uncharacterized protein LOC120668720 [Panicum virgatum]|uniref:DUF659 domain-containing protein n=1 Tax=Panicum virgatum TaxID=38727 RepID=A0A8T0TI21_PANVG|nr:uncharacterized protein LOC120668720 [Panicum virgatum]XP_039804410.1 uncharacterized protein LOC120668720 [Panicum virgatum]XP_039804411.1 uncharacterized protein LOC120668720 [Panicum virgatum]XP_039804412.1 uncharacterized protein LOC120668720 [Panicum virgatum]KAG2608366.1 hypothetical protein PVAP13_4NG315850 [Panicum virgatum]
MATTRTNADGVYLGEGSFRKEFCVPSRQAELSTPSSGQKTNSCNLYEDKSVSHRQESESSMGASDNIDSLVANSIGRLIFEAGLEPDFVHLPSYNGVIDLLTRGVRIAMPSYEYILQVQLSEVQQHERALRQQWEKSGCSVILDRWKSRCGKRFVSVFVHCREGMMFLRSIDISAIFDDVDELAAMVCHVIEDIGVRSIVQIIINDVSPHMQAAEHAVLKKYEQSFIFTVCADHCINLLLENIGALDNVKDVLMKARDITRFLYGHALTMELKRLYIGNADIISNSNLKFVAVFDTLENLVSHRDNLVEMFSSEEWVSSDLASTSLSMHICEVVQTEDAFWSAAANILKVTDPLISVLYKLEGDKCPVSVLYDAMDSAKEDIKRNLGDEHGSYWLMIDHIWDDYLHSPVHAAAYFLNPTIFYSDRFRNDAEISSGITTCILRASKSHYDALLTAEQMDVYLRKSGTFDSDSAVEEAVGTPQDLWWVKHGSGTPALQSFASLILGQTCFGASRYNLDKSLSERLHTERRAYTEQERFRSMEYIYYNLRLASSVPRVAGPPADQHSKLTTHLGDWLSA